MRRSFAAASLAVLLLVPCSDALAVAQRTFVSAIPGVGNDANTVANCSLALPCRSFGAAMTVTATNGEIVVLDSGGYGRVTIDKSVSILAPAGVYAGISVFAGQNGVDITTSGINVTLRGLTINGQGGNRGIHVQASGVRLRVESCLIAGLGDTGLYMLMFSTGDLSVVDTVIRDNAAGVYGIGVRATLERVHVERNVGDGVTLQSSTGQLTDSTIARNGGVGVTIAESGSATTVALIAGVASTDNGGDGIRVQTATGIVLVSVSGATIGGNGGTGIAALGSGSGVARVEVVNSAIKANTSTGLQVTRLSGAAATVLTATDNLVSGNGGRGIFATGNDIYAILNRNTITMNTGVGIEQATSAVVESRGDNVVRGNNGGAAQTAGAITGIPGI
jgi:hypothetical protein